MFYNSKHRVMTRKVLQQYNWTQRYALGVHNVTFVIIHTSSTWPPAHSVIRGHVTIRNIEFRALELFIVRSIQIQIIQKTKNCCTPKLKSRYIRPMYRVIFF